MSPASNKRPDYNPFDDEIDLKSILGQYLSRWKWVLGCLIVFVSGAVLYVTFTRPLYQVSASVLIKDDKKGGMLSEISAFDDLGLLDELENNIDNEIEILKSRTLMKSVALKLKLTQSVFLNNTTVTKELYDDVPFYLVGLNGDTSLQFIDTSFTLNVVSDSSFQLAANKDDKGVKISVKFNQPFDLAGNTLKLVPTQSELVHKLIGTDLRVELTPLEEVVNNYLEKLQITAVSKSSSVIKIVLVDHIRQKAIDLINTLIQEYDEDGINDLNLVSKNTAEFIDERIKVVSAELSDVEGTSKDYKTQHNFMDVVSENGIYLSNMSLNEKNIIETGTEVQMVDFMLRFISQEENGVDLIPSNLGLSDQTIGQAIANHNKLVLERNRMLKHSGPGNPLIVGLNDQIINMKKSITESLRNLKTAYLVKIEELQKTEKELNSKINAAPKIEQEYRAIQRQRQIKESLYLYLLEKREETAIALAATISHTKVIDKAYGQDTPVAPKIKVPILIALILGFAFPIAVIYLINLLDNKVQGPIDIINSEIPLLGEVPKIQTWKKTLIKKESRDVLSEAFRHIRTNVNFMLPDLRTTAKTIVVTSTIAGEGKSFVSINLASVLAISGKKTLLLGMDLRAPALADYLDLKNNPGVTSYLNNTDTKLDDIIQNIENIDNLDFIDAGFIPPNPAELIMRSGTQKLFDELKARYDCIIVDTPPVSLVTDTLLFADYADITAFVVRADYLDKRMLSIAEKLNQERRLPKMTFIINSTISSKGYGYNYGYGYGYGEK